MVLSLLLIIVAIVLGIRRGGEGTVLSSDHRCGRPHCRPRPGGHADPPKRQAPGPVTLAASRWLTGSSGHPSPPTSAAAVQRRPGGLLVRSGFIGDDRPSRLHWRLCCPASQQVNHTIPLNGTSGEPCHHESPTSTKAAHPAASATAVTAIFHT